MQLQRKRMVLSVKRVGQNCTTTKDPKERNYQTLVRFFLCSTSMWADDDIERNITSSDVDFLEGNEEKKTRSHVKTSKNTRVPGEVSFVLDENVG